MNPCHIRCLALLCRLSNSASPRLSSLLDKTSAFCAARNIDASVILQSRLAPDMFAFVRQVQLATDQAKNGAARLAGVEPPHYEDNETTIEQLKTHIDATIGYLETLDPVRIDASEHREIISSGTERQGKHERR